MDIVINGADNPFKAMGLEEFTRASSALATTRCSSMLTAATRSSE